jgi:hypothetical protein
MTIRLLLVAVAPFRIANLAHARFVDGLQLSQPDRA